MRTLRLFAGELWYLQISYWRNRAGAFFTFALPLMLLMLFGLTFSGERLSAHSSVSYDQYFVPAILTFGIISACYATMATSLSSQRELGILKRLRATPLSPAIFLTATVVNSLIVSAVLVVITLSVGVGLYHIVIPPHLVALSVSLVVGSVAFCAIGIAVTIVIPNVDAAPAIVNGLYLPLLFVSGTFFPISSTSLLGRVAAFFPVRPFVLTTFHALDPAVRGTSAIEPFELLVIALWGSLAAVVALWRFRFTPRRAR